jgi:sec-independent protein translocase protein TatB
MAGTLFGRAQRYLNEVKAEVGREIELEELRKMQSEMQEAASGIENSIAQGLSEARADIRSALNEEDGDAQIPSSGIEQRFTARAKEFRKRKLARTSAIPSWYKQQTGGRNHVISAAARVAKYRPAKGGKSPSFF